MKLQLAMLLAATLPSTAAAQDAPPADAPAAEPAGPTTYTIDPNQSVLIVRTYKAGIAGALAHDHAIRSMQTTGSITWQAGGAGCNFDITVNVPSFRVDHISDRKLMGLDGEVSEGQIKDITANMVAKDQLNVATHKTMTFKASSCTATDVSGTLTIVGKGVAKKVPLQINVSGDELRAKGTLNFKHTEFGITPYSTGFGAIQNDDKLTMKIDIAARK